MYCILCIIFLNCMWRMNEAKRYKRIENRILAIGRDGTNPNILMALHIEDISDTRATVARIQHRIMPCNDARMLILSNASV